VFGLVVLFGGGGGGGGGGGWHLDTRWWGTATKAFILPSGEGQNVDVSEHPFRETAHLPPTPPLSRH